MKNPKNQFWLSLETFASKSSHVVEYEKKVLALAIIPHHTYAKIPIFLSLSLKTENLWLDWTHLHSRFGEVDFHGDFLARINVWIVSLLECTLELLQLGWRKCRSYSALLALLTQHWVVRWVNFVGKTGWKNTKKKIVRTFCNPPWINFSSYKVKMNWKIKKILLLPSFSTFFLPSFKVARNREKKKRRWEEIYSTIWVINMHNRNQQRQWNEGRRKNFFFARFEIFIERRKMAKL